VRSDRGNVILNEMKDPGRWMDPSATPQDDIKRGDDKCAQDDMCAQDDKCTLG